MANYADEIERLIPADHLRQLLTEAFNYFEEANHNGPKRRDEDGRRSAEQTRQIVEAHKQGWEKTARAIEDGLKEIARAIRDSNR